MCDLLAKLRSAGIQALALDNGKLRLVGDEIPSDLAELAAVHKSELLAALAAEIASNGQTGNAGDRPPCAKPARSVGYSYVTESADVLSIAVAIQGSRRVALDCETTRRDVKT
jgi:hypothetical protein